ncbi:MAG: lysophospholipid acyltransferase family protein [Gammaproteobacteria bacterium]|nr:lysophospholipid acyltransferase family protein [Gammaproteobacteria bacterium]
MLKKLEYWLVKILYETLSRIPFSFCHYLANFLAFLFQHLFKYRKQVVKANLAQAFPGLTSKEQQQITKEVYQNFAYFMVELLQGWRFNREFMQQNLTVHNWQVIEEAMQEQKGMILVTGHLGNFEWGGSFACSKYENVYAVVKPIHNKQINDLVVKTREVLGFKLLSTGNVYKQGLTVLRNNGMLAIVADQDAGKHGVFVDFFGMPASTAKGVALLHLKTGAPIVMGVAVRRSWGVFECHCERISACCSNNEVSPENIQAITQAHTSALERWIRKYPGQYLWTHRRWKTTPIDGQS